MRPLLVFYCPVCLVEVLQWLKTEVSRDWAGTAATIRVVWWLLSETLIKGKLWQIQRLTLLKHLRFVIYPVGCKCPKYLCWTVSCCRGGAGTLQQVKTIDLHALQLASDSLPQTGFRSPKLDWTQLVRSFHKIKKLSSYLLNYVVVFSKRFIVHFLLKNLSEIMFDNKSELLCLKLVR